MGSSKPKYTKAEYMRMVHQKLPSGYIFSIPYGHTVSSTKISVKCKEGHVHVITINNILRGSHCKTCARIGVANNQRLSREDRIAQCRAVHGDKYDYSFFPDVIKNNKEKVKIICPEHGLYEQRLNDHIVQAKGCMRCSHDSNNGYIAMFTHHGKPMLKFGISKNPVERMEYLKKENERNFTLLWQCQFEGYYQSHAAENEIKRLIKFGALTEDQFPFGHSETCTPKYYDQIVEIFESLGGKRL